MKEAKIIAMTCTHAALRRHDMVELGFKVGSFYINVCNAPVNVMPMEGEDVQEWVFDTFAVF